jgi:hypothetical protein
MEFREMTMKKLNPCGGIAKFIFSSFLLDYNWRNECDMWWEETAGIIGYLYSWDSRFETSQEYSVTVLNIFMSLFHPYRRIPSFTLTHAAAIFSPFLQNSSRIILRSINAEIDLKLLNNLRSIYLTLYDGTNLLQLFLCFSETAIERP